MGADKVLRLKAENILVERQVIERFDYRQKLMTIVVAQGILIGFCGYLHWVSDFQDPMTIGIIFFGASTVGTMEFVLTIGDFMVYKSGWKLRVNSELVEKMSDRSTRQSITRNSVQRKLAWGYFSVVLGLFISNTVLPVIRPYLKHFVFVFGVLAGLVYPYWRYISIRSERQDIAQTAINCSDFDL